MNTGLGGRAADHADGLARAFARARVGLCALAAHRQTAQVPDAAITLDALEPLQVHADLAAQIAFDDVFPVLDGMNDLGKLLLRQVLGADRRLDIGSGQDVLRVAWANAVNVAHRDVNAFVGRYFYSDDT